MTRHTVDLAGRHLSFLQSGEGYALILLHAFPLTAEMWAPQHESVPHGCQLITPDLRGLGQSRGPAATSVDDHAEDVLALMRHLGLERAIIGGLSLGGYITLALHRKASHHFAGLVLADTRAEADTPEARASREEMQRTTRERGASAVAAAMIPKLLGPSALASAAIPDRVRTLITANSTEGIVDALEALKTRPDSSSSLAAINRPTLIIVGRDDGLTPVAMSESMHAVIPRSTLHVIPDAGHLSSLEQPQAFNKALWDFCERFRG
jgi:3-oxoadipate enol-lactonase